MKKVLVCLFVMLSTCLFAQDVNVLLKEADNLERSIKEDQALSKYKQVLQIDKNNVKALIRSAELSCAIGARQADKKAKKPFYDAALDYANNAINIDPKNADANYVRAVVAGKLTEVESDNKKVVGYVKDIRDYVDKALAINPNHAKANYVLGKWNYEVVNLNWAKKAAVKVFFGGLQEAKIEDAFKYMEKCRTLDPYFVLNYLDLVKAYKSDNKPTQAIDILLKLQKLPTRTADDAALKAEGKKLLEELQ